MLPCRWTRNLALLHHTLELWLTMKPLAGTLPVAGTEGKKALESLALAFICFIQEGPQVTVLVTDWQVPDTWSLRTTREPGNATLPCAWRLRAINIPWSALMTTTKPFGLGFDLGLWHFLMIHLRLSKWLSCVLCRKPESFILQWFLVNNHWL